MGGIIMTKQQLLKKGFTLIEVVLVMAIGALIILVVLQAVTAARRSQRDNARKSHAGQISAALEQYASNNNGSYPANGTGFTNFYSAYTPVQGVTYTDVGACTNPQAASTKEVMYVPSGTNNTSFTLRVCLEVGGSAPIGN